MRLIIIFGWITLLVSCATAPTLQIADIPAGSKVGFVSLVDDRPKHEHFGLTVFENKTVQILGDWGVQAYGLKTLQELLPEYDVISVSATEKLLEKRLDLITTVGWSGFDLSDEVKLLVSEYKTLHDLDALVILRPYRIVGSGAYGALNGYGLYSVCQLGRCRYEALSKISVLVAATDPAAYIGSDSEYRPPETLDISRVTKPNELTPDQLLLSKDIVLNEISLEMKGALITAGLIKEAE